MSVKKLQGERRVTGIIHEIITYLLLLSALEFPKCFLYRFSKNILVRIHGSYYPRFINNETIKL